VIVLHAGSERQITVRIKIKINVKVNIKINVKVNIKINVKCDGQECPSHTFTTG
jgi:hypothetical protein